MANFDCLSFDEIDYIMNCDCISYSDVCRLSSVSKTFNRVSRTNRLWRNKYRNMWPELVDLYDARNTNWLYEFRLRFDYRISINKKLSEMSAKYYFEENLSKDTFWYFKHLAEKHPYGHQIVKNELECIINHSDSHLSLTRKYYASQALRYMQHLEMVVNWGNYLSCPHDKVSLVEGACLVSQWCDPTLPNCTSQVRSQIEDIARQVLEKIRVLYPNHPVLENDLLEDDAISTSLWSPFQCNNILCSINKVMFEDLKFTGNHHVEFYSADATFIEKVLTKRTGISITLGIIYSAVAAKLGVSCLYVNFPGHFLLKWQKFPELHETEAFVYIDVIENGCFKSPSELSGIINGYNSVLPEWTEAVPPVKVLIRLAWYLVEFGRQMDGGDSLALCNALELLCLLSPDDLEHKLLLARLFMHLGINIAEAISMLQEIAANDPTSQLTISYMYQSTLRALEVQNISGPPSQGNPKHRDKSNASIKFAVGMIMRHKTYNLRCVIYGWDCTCTASDEWIKKMEVHSLEHKVDQPFYYVLTEDGSSRYAAQENLEIDHEPEAVPHKKIGRYFESYHGNYYLPNEETLLEYPEDFKVCENALLNQEQ